LPDEQQLTIVLYFYGDYALAEVADVLHRTESRACQIKQTALATLRKLLRGKIDR
ncbi:unnamed protein product, partial [marine sediment metagenome]